MSAEPRALGFSFRPACGSFRRAMRQMKDFQTQEQLEQHLNARIASLVHYGYDQRCRWQTYLVLAHTEWSIEPEIVGFASGGVALVMPKLVEQGRS